MFIDTHRKCTSKMWLKFVLISILGWPGILTTSFDLGGVISGNRMAGIPLGRSLGEGEVDVEGVCTENGWTCQNCTHMVTCIPLPIGWLKVPLQECPKDQTCNAQTGKCSSDPVPECSADSQKFVHTCEQVGIFPDAFDCRKFHLCSPPEGSPSGSPADHRVGLCPRNYGYNPSTAQCSEKLYKGQCSVKPVPDCKEIGDYDVLPSSPNHYYVCLRKRKMLYPQIFICPHGWFFWDGFCRPEPRISLSSTTSTEIMASTTEEVTTKKFSINEALFAVDKLTTTKPDTFLADKYGDYILENYDPLAHEEAPEEWHESINSWENS